VELAFDLRRSCRLKALLMRLVVVTEPDVVSVSLELLSEELELLDEWSNAP